MPSYLSHIARHQPKSRPGLGAFKHPDVDLLAHMAIMSCAETYKTSGQLQPRVGSFDVAYSYVISHISPHSTALPALLAKQSVFLGQGPFEHGSLRKFVGDLHGLVLAQRMLAGELPRRRKHADSHATSIRKHAQAHLQQLICSIDACPEGRHCSDLIAALHQLHTELF